MTNEVAEKIVRGIEDKIECNTVDIDAWAEFWGFTREEYEEFLDIAVKALEQESILDKIRAEIERHRRKTESIDTYDLVGDCLDIIDKYMTESEK